MCLPAIFPALAIWELGPCRYVWISYHIQTYPDLFVHILKLWISSTDRYLVHLEIHLDIHLEIQMDIHAYPTGYPCSYPIVSNAISTLYMMNSPSISNWLSTPIQQFIQTYPKGYPISNWISIGISGLICGQGIQAGSCIAIQICILAPGPALSAALDGWPPCYERKRGVRNACSYPTAGQPAVRHPAGPLCCRRHCCAAATNAAQQAAASFRCSRHGFVTLLIHK